MTLSFYLSTIAIITFFYWGDYGDDNTTVVCTLPPVVFVTADSTTVFFETVFSSTSLIKTFWIVFESLITFTSLVVWVSMPETGFTVN